MFLAHSGMDGEVVNPLLTLLDQGVAVYLPSEFTHVAVHFFKSLVNGHSSHRHRTIAYDPLAGFMDIVAGAQIH